MSKGQSSIEFLSVFLLTLVFVGLVSSSLLSMNEKIKAHNSRLAALTGLLEYARKIDLARVNHILSIRGNSNYTLEGGSVMVEAGDGVLIEPVLEGGAYEPQ